MYLENHVPMCWAWSLCSCSHKEARSYDRYAEIGGAGGRKQAEFWISRYLERADRAVFELGRVVKLYIRTGSPGEEAEAVRHPGRRCCQCAMSECGRAFAERSGRGERQYVVVPSSFAIVC